MKLYGHLLVTSLTIILIGCGGGGGGSKGGRTAITSSSVSSSTSSQPNTPLTVTIAAPGSAEINDVVTLTANATNSDEAVIYNWVVEAGPSLTLSDSTKAQVSFTAPDVTQNTDVTLAVTVTNKAGASSKATAKIAILAKRSALTINGLVTDSVLANADIVVTIRDLSFKTKTDSSGHYSVAIAVDEAHLNDLVLITAQGSGAQSQVKLASILPSTNKLMLQAGQDKVLDVAENFNVNVTNVSTAEFALLTAPSDVGTGKRVLVNDTDLSNAMRQVSFASKFYSAAVIKLIADKGFSLPDGVDSTLDLALNQGKFEEFIKLINLQDQSLIDKTISEVESDNNVTDKSNWSLSGTYILDVQGSSISNMLTFNENFTGSYASGIDKTTFTWNQVDDVTTIIFDVPLNLVYEGEVIKKIEFYLLNSSSPLKSGVLYTYNDSASFPKIKPAKLVDISKTLKIQSEKLTGDWFYENGNNIKFNSNGTAVTKLANSTEAAFESSWSLPINSLKLSGVGRSTEFYLINDLGIGYEYVSIERNAHSMYVAEGLLIKSQENLHLTKADLVGTWLDSNGEVFILGSDDLKILNFGSGIRPWQFTEDKNSWGEAFYQQQGVMADMRGGECNSVSKYPCKPWRTNTNQIIAQSGNNFYSLYKTTIFDSGVPSDFLTLKQMRKLSAITQFGSWISRNNSQKFYQQTSTGVKVWNFSENQLVIADNSLNFPQFAAATKINFILYNGKLRYTRDNTKRELELVSASETGLIVCEYSEGSSCVKGTEFVLGNRSPAKISLKVVGAGYVDYGFQWSQFYSNPTYDELFLFGNKASYRIIPEAGSSLQSVSGCNGTLTDIFYETAEIKDACTITATFVKD